LKIHAFLLFHTTHITVFHTIISPARATLFLALPANIANEISRFGGEIKTASIHFMTAYHSFEIYGQ
jgi:hypothetical protein